MNEAGARDDGEFVSCMEPMLPAEGAAGWRGRVPTPLGLGERQVRDVVAELSGASLLEASRHRAPLRLAFNVTAGER